MRCAATVVSLLAVLTVFAPSVAAAGEPKLEGSYSVTGVNPDGTEYRGSGEDHQARKHLPRELDGSPCV